MNAPALTEKDGSPSRFLRMQLTIPESDWEKTGSEEDPASRLYYTGMSINGLSMHVEAIAVIEKDEQHDYGEQTAADIMFEDEVGTLQDMCDTAFQTTTINGREYVLVATPHGR